MDTQPTDTDTYEAPGGLEIARNVITGRPYQGGNILRLAAAQLEHGWRDSRWGGYNQLQDAGYQVAKGQSSTEILVVIGGATSSGDASTSSGGPTVDVAGDDRPRGRGVRIARVFNVAQCARMTEAEIVAAREARAARAARAEERRAAGGGKAKKRKARKN